VCGNQRALRDEYTNDVFSSVLALENNGDRRRVGDSRESCIGEGRKNSAISTMLR
jgi:hypothetical protein